MEWLLTLLNMLTTISTFVKNFADAYKSYKEAKSKDSNNESVKPN